VLILSVCIRKRGAEQPKFPAGFLLSARNQYWLVSYSTAHFRQRMDFGYLQDDIKMSHRLTLNTGSCYEFATPNTIVTTT
jgi:hypothetical protein